MTVPASRHVFSTFNAPAAAGAFLIAVLAWIAAAGVASGAEKNKVPPELQAMIVSAVDGAIVPAYQFFADVSIKATELVGAWCDNPSTPTLQAARAAFGGSVHAWARIQHIRFGPARTDNRWQRIAFLPDPRGVVRRQVAKTLAERPQNLLKPTAIGEQSAALQGLPAVEILLFATPQDEAPEALAYRCRLAHSISTYVAMLARNMLDEWTAPNGWRQHMLSAGPENKDYRSPNEAAAELVRTLLTGLQIVREEMLLPWLKAAEAKKAWAGLPFERSGRARDVVSTAIYALDNLHRALHLNKVVEVISHKDPSKAWIKKWIGGVFGSLERDAEAMALPSAETLEAFGSEENLRVLRRSRLNINGLRQIIGRQIAPEAALTIGFNELDGD